MRKEKGKMKNIVKVWRSSTAFQLSAFSFLILITSCSQEEMFEPAVPQGMRFNVSDFPAYDAPQTRVIGIPEDGKTEWEEGDEILVIFDSPKCGVQSATLTYTEAQWTLPEGVTFNYIPGETPRISAMYSPICTILDGMFVTDQEFGTTECLYGNCNLSADGTSIDISFSGRTYSRLRIAAEAEQELHVHVTDFTPAGMNQANDYTYIVHANEHGNAFLYGTFAEGATVSVKQGDVVLKDYTFTAEKNPNGTVYNKSYALDARPKKEGKSIVFVEGVTQESGWYDVNKVGMGTNGDINMCWAAAASNIIQWWQDRYIAAGNTLPAQAVTGPGATYELALMEVFHQQWNNEKGGQVVEAVPWYFEGKYYGVTASAGSQAFPLQENSGGYFKDVWNDILPHLYHEYTYMFGMYTNLYAGDFNNYELWGNGSGLQGKARLKYFTDLVVQFIDRGIASLTVSLSSDLRTLHHATTIWGYEIDHETGLLTRLWITDSDDLEKSPKEQLLNEYQVSIADGNAHIKLSSDNVRYGACYAVGLTPVSGYKP